MRNWRAEHRRLLARVDELNAQGGVDKQECSRLREEALDVINLAGLSSNPLYKQIENLRRENFLSNLRGRLEFALKLVEAFQRRRRSRIRPGSRFPSPVAGSEARAKTVALLFQELRIVAPHLTNGEAYQEVRRSHGNLKIFEILETRPKLQSDLVQSESSRGLLGRAQLLAAHYHGRELSTLKTDWKRFKPRKFRRKPSAASESHILALRPPAS